jgi:hypothetical protein
LRFADLFGRHGPDSLVHIFQVGDVKPHDIRVYLNPILLGEQQRGRAAPLLRQLLQLPDALAEVLPGSLGVAFGPQSRREHVPVVRPVPEQQKVGDDLLQAAAVHLRPLACGGASREPTQEGEGVRAAQGLRRPGNACWVFVGDRARDSLSALGCHDLLQPIQRAPGEHPDIRGFSRYL